MQWDGCSARLAALSSPFYTLLHRGAFNCCNHIESRGGGIVGWAYAGKTWRDNDSRPPTGISGLPQNSLKAWFGEVFALLEEMCPNLLLSRFATVLDPQFEVKPDTLRLDSYC